MTMKTKANLSTQQRSSILQSALSTYDRGSFAAQDRAFYKRVALLGMIRNMAVNPTQALR